MSEQNVSGNEKEIRNDNDYLEETAQDVAPILTGGTSPIDHQDEKRIEEDNDTTRKGLGWFALAMSIVSLFIFPVLLGAVGIITGFMARRRGISGLGNWAIGIGLVSLIVQLFIAPFL